VRYISRETRNGKQPGVLSDAGMLCARCYLYYFAITLKIGVIAKFSNLEALSFN